MVSGYPGYQSAVLSIDIYRHIQRDKQWYLGIQCISMQGFSAYMYIYTHIQGDKPWYLVIQHINLVGLYVCIHTDMQRDKLWYLGIQGIEVSILSVLGRQ